MEYEYED